MMPRRDRRGARLGALVALALGAASCSTRVPVDLATAPAACVVARGEGFVLTLGDSETLRLSQGPALTREEGTRLAVDAALASWLEHGEVRVDPRQRLEALRAQSLRLSADPDLRDRELDRARIALNLQTGPCHIARR